MALTAREWLLLPKEEQRERGEELSSEGRETPSVFPFFVVIMMTPLEAREP